MTTPVQVDVAEATPEFELAAKKAASRRGFLLAAPAYLYLLIFFVIPLVIVFAYSFARRNAQREAVFDTLSFDAYTKLFDDTVRDIVLRSFGLALMTTVICLIFAYPFAYFLATRSPKVRNLALVFVMIPFWSNFLVRNYAWRVILGNDGIMSRASEVLGFGETDLLFTKTAVVLGLVYGFLPFMVLPLYASLERIDLDLVEASRDLYASGFQTFRRVLLPLSMPGVIAGSILVFVPSLGAYVTPEILGGAKTTLLGSYVVTQFTGAANWPVGSAISFVVMVVMLAATLVYFRSGAKTL